MASLRTIPIHQILWLTDKFTSKSKWNKKQLSIFWISSISFIFAPAYWNIDWKLFDKHLILLARSKQIHYFVTFPETAQVYGKGNFSYKVPSDKNHHRVLSPIPFTFDVNWYRRLPYFLPDCGTHRLKERWLAGSVFKSCIGVSRF